MSFRSEFKGGGRTRRVAAAWLAVLGAAVLRSDAIIADTIIMVSGVSHEDVTVTNATWENVGFKRGELPQSVPGDEVLSLQRSSPRLDPIRKAIDEGKFQEALRRAGDAIDFGRSWEKAEAAYLKGKAYLEWSGRDPSQVRKAIGALESYLKTYSGKKDFFVPAATFDLGQACLASKDYASAEKHFRSLEAFGVKGGGIRGRNGGGKWGYKLKIGLGRTLMAAGQNLPEARRYFDQVSRDRKAPPEIRRQAEVLRARVQVMEGQQREAIRAMSSFVAHDAVQDEANALAMLVLGDAFRSQKGTANQREAELWYLKTTLFGKRYQAVYREAAEKLAGVYRDLGSAERAREWAAKVK